MHLSTGQTASILGVSIATLRRWDRDGYLKPTFRTAGGHRRYDLASLETRFFHENKLAERPKSKALAYGRVSSYDQLSDLETQKKKLESYCLQNFDDFEILTDLGSGLNYKKPGLKRLSRLIFQRSFTHLVINHKDRLLRFGSEIIFELCRYFGIEVLILETALTKNFEEELAADVIELMTVFSSKLYGKRSHQNRKKVAA
jgi:predicted site-specific integrase-resolvase